MAFARPVFAAVLWVALGVAPIARADVPAPSKVDAAATPPAAAVAPAHDDKGESKPGLLDDRKDLKLGLDSEPPEAAEPDGLWSLVRMLVALGVVLGVVYLSLNWGLRKLMGVRAPGLGGGIARVVERVVLDPKTTLFVIRAAGDFLLIGRSEGSVSLLCKLDAVEVERLEREKATSGGGPALSPFLQKLLSRRGGPPPPTA